MALDVGRPLTRDLQPVWLDFPGFPESLFNRQATHSRRVSQYFPLTILYFHRLLAHWIALPPRAPLPTQPTFTFAFQDPIVVTGFCDPRNLHTPCPHVSC